MNSEQYLAGKFFHIQNPVGSVIYFISTYHYSEINFKLNIFLIPILYCTQLSKSDADLFGLKLEKCPPTCFVTVIASNTNESLRHAVPLTGIKSAVDKVFIILTPELRQASVAGINNCSQLFWVIFLLWLTNHRP